MTTTLARQTLAVLVAISPSLAAAADRWEAGSDTALSNDDTAAGTRNELHHGEVQVGHDLEGTSGAPDRDFYIVRGERYHSYEAVVRSGTMFWHRPNVFCGVSPVLCPRFDLVSEAGAVLAAGVPDGAQNTPVVSSTLSVRWSPGSGGVADQTFYLRAMGDVGGQSHTSADQYDVQFRDTTYSIPRYNNSGSQATIVIVQNLTARSVTANLYFVAATGAPLPVSVGSLILPFGQWVYNTSLEPSLAGTSGSIVVAQTGPYGALAGKAVALEPSTGFTFDTAMTPIPH
jgi:hypothetical protein